MTTLSTSARTGIAKKMSGPAIRGATSRIGWRSLRVRFVAEPQLDRLAPRPQRGVHDSAPDPRLEGPRAAEPLPTADRVGESVVHCLDRPLAVAHDRPRNALEVREAEPV